MLLSVSWEMGESSQCIVVVTPAPENTSASSTSTQVLLVMIARKRLLSLLAARKGLREKGNDRTMPTLMITECSSLGPSVSVVQAIREILYARYCKVRVQAQIQFEPWCGQRRRRGLSVRQPGESARGRTGQGI
jgi:hypothetical protein